LFITNRVIIPLWEIDYSFFPSKYLEQNIMHSSAMYHSSIDPSGCAQLQTYPFNHAKYLQFATNI